MPQGQGSASPVTVEEALAAHCRACSQKRHRQGQGNKAKDDEVSKAVATDGAAQEDDQSQGACQGKTRRPRRPRRTDLTRIPRDPTEKSGKRLRQEEGRAAKAATGVGENQSIIRRAVPPRDVLMRFIAENPDTRLQARNCQSIRSRRATTRVELKALLKSLGGRRPGREEAQVARAPRAPFPRLPCSISPSATLTAN